MEGAAASRYCRLRGCYLFRRELEIIGKRKVQKREEDGNFSTAAPSCAVTYAVSVHLRVVLDAE